MVHPTLSSQMKRSPRRCRQSWVCWRVQPKDVLAQAGLHMRGLHFLQVKLSEKVPTEIAKPHAATRHLSAKWTRARFRTSANCICRGPCGTSDDITSYTWLSWLSVTARTMAMTLYLGEKL